MKRILTFLIVAIISIMLFVGCTPESQNEPTQEEQEAAQTQEVLPAQESFVPTLTDESGE